MYITHVTLYNEHYPTRCYYPFNVPTLCGTSQLAFRGQVTFFVGENGSGKSTLLDAITQKCGVQVWDKPKRHIAHANPYESRLVDFIDVTWSGSQIPGSLFRAETFRDLADFLDDVALCDPGRLKYHGGHILNTLSHGEGMLSYFNGRFNMKGLYFLDEPEAALSPSSQVKFLKLLQQLSATGQAQFIIATHSAILLALPQAQIFSFSESHIKEVAYEETEHYQVYKQFFTDRSIFIKAAPGKAGEVAGEPVFAG
ncbi:MAG: ATP-binding cassette domain-containing protein [Anaerolineales bacterium]|nr:MAG: ATP-binding cassette domain-containing protein [Anaerolineales bacterium]